jgi:hypothetical protein
MNATTHVQIAYRVNSKMNLVRAVASAAVNAKLGQEMLVREITKVSVRIVHQGSSSVGIQVKRAVFARQTSTRKVLICTCAQLAQMGSSRMLQANHFASLFQHFRTSIESTKPLLFKQNAQQIPLTEILLEHLLLIALMVFCV